MELYTEELVYASPFTASSRNPHSDIVAELKELIAMHSSMSPHGGDLNKDTVTIIGATLDLQEKVVEQARAMSYTIFCLAILSCYRQ